MKSKKVFGAVDRASNLCCLDLVKNCFKYRQTRINDLSTNFKAMSCTSHSEKCAWPTHDEQIDRAKFLKLSN